MAMTPPEGLKVEVTPDQSVNPEVKAEKSVFEVLKEKATAFGKRLMGVTESRLLPVEAKRMNKLQTEASSHLGELWEKANDERGSSDLLEGVNIVDFRYNYFRSLVNRMKRFFPNDFEVWEGMNLYFGKLDEFKGTSRFTDFGFLNELEAVDSNNLPLLKYSFLALANMNERYAEYFLAHAQDFGSSEKFSTVYGLLLEYPQRYDRGEIDSDLVSEYIRKRLSGSIYR